MAAAARGLGLALRGQGSKTARAANQTLPPCPCHHQGFRKWSKLLWASVRDPRACTCLRVDRARDRRRGSEESCGQTKNTQVAQLRVHASVSTCGGSCSRQIGTLAPEGVRLRQAVRVGATCAWPPTLPSLSSHLHTLRACSQRSLLRVTSVKKKGAGR